MLCCIWSRNELAELFRGIRGQGSQTAYTFSPMFCNLIVYSVGGAFAWQWRQGFGLRATLGSCVLEWRLGSCLRASLGPCVGDADAVH